MFVSDLKPNQAIDVIELEVVDLGEVREFTNFRGTGKVRNVKVKDNTGECTLTLWNDDVDKYSVGQRVRIENGWCKEFRGELQVGTGKFGKISPAEGGGETTPTTKKKAEKHKTESKKKKISEDLLEEEEENITGEEEGDPFEDVKEDEYSKFDETG